MPTTEINRLKKNFPQDYRFYIDQLEKTVEKLQDFTTTFHQKTDYFFWPGDIENLYQLKIHDTPEAEKILLFLKEIAVTFKIHSNIEQLTTIISEIEKILQESAPLLNHIEHTFLSNEKNSFAYAEKVKKEADECWAQTQNKFFPIIEPTNNDWLFFIETLAEQNSIKTQFKTTLLFPIKPAFLPSSGPSIKKPTPATTPPETPTKTQTQNKEQMKNIVSALMRIIFDIIKTHINIHQLLIKTPIGCQYSQQTDYKIACQQLRLFSDATQISNNHSPFHRRAAPDLMGAITGIYWLFLKVASQATERAIKISLSYSAQTWYNTVVQSKNEQLKEWLDRIQSSYIAPKTLLSRISSS